MTDFEYLLHMIGLFASMATLAWIAIASIAISRKVSRIEKEVKA